MNNKVLLAFLGGLVVASGVMYIAMRPSQPAPVAAVAPAPQAPAAAAQPAVQPEPDAKPATAAEVTPVETPQRSRPAEVPKPSAARRAGARPDKPIASPVPAAETPKPSASVPPATVPSPAPVEAAKAAEPAPAPLNPVTAPRLDPPAPKANTVTIPAGTTLTVRIGEALSSEREKPGDTFSATLDQPLVIDGFVIAERGSRAQGRIVEAERAGKVKGLASLGIELTQISTSDGQRVKVNTGAFKKQADSSRKKDAAKVGIGAALGAAIGAIAGGGKGAGIGAGVGGAAGAGDVLLTRGSAAELPVEARVTFRLAEPVTITEKLR